MQATQFYSVLLHCYCPLTFPQCRLTLRNSPPTHQLQSPSGLPLQCSSCLPPPPPRAAVQPAIRLRASLLSVCKGVRTVPDSPLCPACHVISFLRVPVDVSDPRCARGRMPSDPRCACGRMPAGPAGPRAMPIAAGHVVRVAGKGPPEGPVLRIDSPENVFGGVGFREDLPIGHVPLVRSGRRHAFPGPQADEGHGACTETGIGMSVGGTSARSYGLSWKPMPVVPACP